MNSNNISYYPYASFTGEQQLLLKAAALYFDKLYILDPLKANWAGIGQYPLSHDLKLLEKEKILARIAPEEVLNKYENIIAKSIRFDMRDPAVLEFQKMRNIEPAGMVDERTAVMISRKVRSVSSASACSFTRCRGRIVS